MSIATTENPASVRALDARHAAQDALSDNEQHAREEIAQAFAFMRRVPADKISVPSVNYLHRRPCIVSLSHAVAELLEGGECASELLAVLEHSACPHVVALRAALCAAWQRQYAADIAEVSQ